jgi:hypothetical protein
LLRRAIGEVIGRWRAGTTDRGISERIHVTPAHNSVITWAQQRPSTLRESQLQTVDSLGRSKRMQIQTWVWMIGLTDAEDGVLEWAKVLGRCQRLKNWWGGWKSNPRAGEALFG